MTGPDVLVFGCWGEGGHFKRGAGWGSLRHEECYRLERWADSHGVGLPADPPEGQAFALRIHLGWTSLSWWDRHGPDQRGGCHTTILARGVWTAQQMLTAAPAWAVRVDVDLSGVLPPGGG